MASSDRDSRRVELPPLDYRFPNTCVCCQAPATQHRDRTLAKQKTFSLPPAEGQFAASRLLTTSLRGTVRGIALCDEHAAVFDREADGQPPCGLFIRLSGTVTNKTATNPTVNVGVTLEFTNTGYAQSFRDLNRLMTPREAKGGGTFRVSSLWSHLRLNRHETRRDVAAIIPYLSHRDDEVIGHALYALSACEKDETLGSADAALSALEAHPRADIRRDAAQLLALIRKPGRNTRFLP